MPWWLALAGLVLALGLGWLVTIWLFGEADPGNTRAQLRIDAIRTGLTVVAGVGGAVALLLTARRQWLNERAQRHQEWVDARSREHAERVQNHQEGVAAASQRHQELLAQQSEHDATERRVTELFARAVDHLGSEKPAVRLGGLYALERLAAQHREHRQSIINVICAYLRMARREGDGGASVGDGAERQVRAAAQGVLRRHLDASDLEVFWPSLQIELAGAVLDGFDGRGCTFARADFTGAVFCGPTVLDGARFTDRASFEAAVFQDDVIFDGSEWLTDARFTGAQFAGRADFADVRMAADTAFGGVRFGDDVSFGGAVFDGTVAFDKASFASAASFSQARFGRGASFEHATFTKAVSYRNASFADVAMFRWARFEDVALFDGTEFETVATFAKATFGGQVVIEAPIPARVEYFDGLRASSHALRRWPPGWEEELVDEKWVTIAPPQRDRSS